MAIMYIHSMISAISFQRNIQNKADQFSPTLQTFCIFKSKIIIPNGIADYFQALIVIKILLQKIILKKGT